MIVLILSKSGTCGLVSGWSFVDFKASDQAGAGLGRIGRSRIEPIFGPFINERRSIKTANQAQRKTGRHAKRKSGNRFWGRESPHQLLLKKAPLPLTEALGP